MLITLLITTLLPAWANAAGLLKPLNSQLPDLDMLSHDVSVTIESGYAITTIDQVFHNPNTAALEAVYSFPVPEKAAVGQFTYWINGQPIHGEVVEKQKAREIYEQEKNQGRDAGLTEQDDYRTFDISVSQVQPQQDTRIRLVYFQPVDIDTGIGRYVYPLEDGGVDEHKLAFWTANESVRERFSFQLEMKSGYPIEAFRLPHHPQAAITRMDDQHWQVSLIADHQSANPKAADLDASTQAPTPSRQSLLDEAPSPSSPTNHSPGVYRLDRDIVVYWRLQQGLPGSIDLVTYKAPDQARGTFMMTLTPGDDLAPINEGRDWVLVLDRSGSMSGKYSTLAEGVRKGFDKFNANDRIRVIMFNHSAHEITRGWQHATPENLDRLSQLIEGTQAEGSTNLMDGIRLGLRNLDSDRTTAIWLVTDGVANVGETRQKAFLDLLKQQDVRLFTFVMGNSANRPLLEAMTRQSNGFATSVSNSDDIVGQLLQAASKVSHEALHDVNVSIEGVKTADIFPQQPGSLYRGEQLQIFGHYFGEGKVKVTLTGKRSGRPVSYSSEFTLGDQSAHPELERLWAFAQIEHLMMEQRDYGEDADRQEAVVDLAKEYGLVTNYTSMLVLEDERFKQYGIKRRIGDRISEEESARTKRSQQPANSQRVDQHQPAFSSPRSSYGGGGGGGSLNLWAIALLSLLWTLSLRYRKQQ
ncbi:VIT and vWA domain-containing protein [Hahella ganghwensis]|uniref:VIT and vWA domain-containing protein n=1 Tax=Hahella ganghwensis TaxID=286420 RepID=UPI0003626EA5|nr:VIT and VWA domain-containing protein [Hahella ganghwensis]